MRTLDPFQAVPPPAFSYAGFWRRFVAYVIDKIIIGAVCLIIFLPAFGVLGLGALNWDEVGEAPVGFILAFISAFFFAIALCALLQWLYFALLESKRGATFGKMAIGIEVVDQQGNRISFGRATGRYFAKFLSGLVFGIGYIIAGFTQQKQALHDILAGCLVINKR